MRFVEITHTYVLEVGVDDVEAIDMVAGAGVSMMENFMRDRAPKIMDLRSDWRMMPKEYRPTQPVPYDDQKTHLDLYREGMPVPEEVQGEITYDKGAVPEKVFTDTPHERDRIESLKIIEADADQGISFTQDVMRQLQSPPPHPWDSGIRVTPQGHDLFAAETEALRQEGKLCGYRVEPDYECVLVTGHPGDHLLEPTSGSRAKEITDGTEG